jgi:hypothetical protein
MEGVTFRTSTDRERRDEYLGHFFKEIDKGVHRLLRDDTAPLILAGVEYEIAGYRRVNTHSRLLEKAIHGSPDTMTARELHQYAMEIVMHSFSEPLQKALAHFEKLRDSPRVSLKWNAILTAAFEGRIADLLFSTDVEQRGVWNESLHEIQAQTDDGFEEDLVNVAALQTVLHRGQAFALRAQEMPEKADAVAVLRF